MLHAGERLTDCCESLGANELLLKLAFVSNVLADRERADGKAERTAKTRR